MMKVKNLSITLNHAILLVALVTSFTQAYGSSTQSNVEKKSVQSSMKEYVKRHTGHDGLLPIVYKGKVLKLKLFTSKKYPDGFHSGVQENGNLFASCADFVDPKTQDKYDIDFLVQKNNTTYDVVQPIVHSINGKKDAYDLKH